MGYWDCDKDTDMKFFKRQLQLAASVPIHSTMFWIQFLNPKFFSDTEVHWVRVPDFFQDGHRHIRYFVARAIKVGPDSFLQIGPMTHDQNKMQQHNNNFNSNVPSLSNNKILLNIIEYESSSSEQVWSLEPALTVIQQGTCHHHSQDILLPPCLSCNNLVLS